MIEAFRIGRGIDDDIALAERSAEAAQEHGRGTISALMASNNFVEATNVRNQLQKEEGLCLSPREDPLSQVDFEEFRPTPPSPKLPAYLPEIDLEGVPKIDLNRFFGRALPSDEAARSLWRH